MAEKKIPFRFVLEELESLAPAVKPMFGSHAIYVGDHILFILRQRDQHVDDNGVWVAMPAEHREAVKREFPVMRDIALFGPGPTGWQNVPQDSPRFEETMMRLIELAKARDPRIGKLPSGKARKLGRSKPSAVAKKAVRKKPAAKARMKTRSK